MKAEEIDCTSSGLHDAGRASTGDLLDLIIGGR